MTSRSTSARPTSAAWSGRSTSTGIPSTASTTSSCRPTTASSASPRARAREERFRFRPTEVGFYDDGRLFSMTSPTEFLTFPSCASTTGCASGAFVARCQLKKTYDELDDVPLVEWLLRLCGKRIVERLWGPLLDSKFDGRFDDLPATYIWARTRRMSSTRDSAGREIMGWLEGGYQTLIDALERASASSAARSTPGAPSNEIVARPTASAGSSSTARSARSTRALHADAAPGPALLRRTSSQQAPGRPLPLSRRHLPPGADEPQRQPLLPPQHHRPPRAADNGRRDDARRRSRAGRRPAPLRHEVRRPELADLDAQPSTRSSATILAHARTIFPDLRDDEILDANVQRARVTEPVHLLGGAKNVLPRSFPVPGLALASTAHVYPEIVSGQAVIGVADRVVSGILERLPAARKGTQRERAEEETDQEGRGHRSRRASSARTSPTGCCRTETRWSESTTSRTAPSPTSTGFLKPGLPLREAGLHAPARAARGVRRLRRDRAPGREEDPALRRRAPDPRGQRRGRGCGLRRGALARRRPGDGLDVGRLRKRDAAVRRGRQPRDRPADVAPLGVRRLEDVRRALRAGARGGAGSPGHDRAPVRLLRPAEPPELVGRPAS